jgi:phosphopantothenoylcysteine decarboxylase / phosphopantothenate---cysteine ligase
MKHANSRRILLGITGGIAAYKSAELTRLLVQQNIAVQVVMTQAATQFITPVTLQALSGATVYTDLWDARIANNMAHIDLSRECDAILIAPASADFIAKLTHGLADDLLSTLCLARECPLLIAPAMNRQMWEQPANQRNLAQLRADGVRILGPAAGDQACGEIGMGRMLEPQQLLDECIALYAAPVLNDQHILVTAGPTLERIDSVRAITNLSSGKMGYALAQAALDAGASVTLVSGPTHLDAPSGANVMRVNSAQEMFDAVLREVARADIFISVAAVADYTVKRPSATKIKKANHALTLELEPTKDILAHVAALPNAPFCVGFAAESENLREYAREKRTRKKIPLLAANLVQNAMGSDDNELVLFDDHGEHHLARAPKIVLARQLIEHIARLRRTSSAGIGKKKPKTIAT